MRTIVKNIAILGGVDRHGKLRLQGEEMKEFETIENAWLEIENGIIKGFGKMGDGAAEAKHGADVCVVDAEGGTVMPSFCDSHTHIVFAASREHEFVDKIRGLSYAEIAKRGGGILNSADRLHELTEDELYGQAMRRIREIIRKGTGAVEIKSGYGLNTEDELKMLRVVKRIKETTPLKVVATFLGAHAVSREYIGRQA